MGGWYGLTTVEGDSMVLYLCTYIHVVIRTEHGVYIKVCTTVPALYVYSPLCVHVYMYTYSIVHTVCTYVCTCTYVCMYVCMYVHVCMYV